MNGLELAWKARNDHRAQQKPSELGPLLELLSGRGVRNALEIGGMYGGTLWAWRHVTAGKLLCIDWFETGGDGRNYLDRERAEGLLEHGPDDFTFINADSQLDSTRDAVVEKLDGESLDFVFIDGDHSLEGVTRDFELYAPLVVPGGIVALHDVCVPQPSMGVAHLVIPLWEELKQRYPYVEIFDATFEDSFGGIGVLFL